MTTYGTKWYPEFDIGKQKISGIRDPDKYISEIRKFIEESELTLQRDNQFNFMSRGEGWDSESLRQEAR